MKLDIHVTTCHRKNLKCRPRPPENSNWNVKPWTLEERLNISKISINSIINFSNQLKIHNHEVNLTILNDGSDIPEAVDWLNSLPVKIKHFNPRGSSAGINDHFMELRQDPPDYIFHLEDDNLLFNPDNTDWLSIINDIQKNCEDIRVFTFRSGLPVEPEDKGFLGAFGPVGSKLINNINCILFGSMGNAHHIMKWSDYCKFMPLTGNTGDCEANMNLKLKSIGLNAEPQIHVHAFHSHMYSYPINSNNLNKWHKTGEGFEFGMYDMDNYLKNKNMVVSKIYKNFPSEMEYKEFSNYAY